MRNSVEQCRSRLKLLVFFFFEFLNYYSKNSWEIQNPTTLPSDFLSETSRDCCDDRIRSKQRRKPKKKNSRHGKTNIIYNSVRSEPENISTNRLQEY